jgi:hypothetical protein
MKKSMRHAMSSHYFPLGCAYALAAAEQIKNPSSLAVSILRNVITTLTCCYFDVLIVSIQTVA